MTNEEKSSLINLLESYKPDGHYYDGYHNFSRRVDEAVCNRLDNVIAEIKQMPTSNAWKNAANRCRKRMKLCLFMNLIQIHKATRFVIQGFELDDDCIYCPLCNKFICNLSAESDFNRISTYCSDCGQALDWSGETE